MRSTFRLTVPQDFYDAACEASGQWFADAHLYGAHLVDDKFTPRTVAAWRNIKNDRGMTDLLAAWKIKLIQPTPWPGDGNRLSAKDAREDAFR